MAGWDTLANLLREEMRQREGEGCDIGDLPRRAGAAGSDVDVLQNLYDEVMALPVRDGYSFVEPDELNAIRAARPDGPRHLADTLTDAQWSAKFQGAWLGRCVGCALGKPLEILPFMHGTADDGAPTSATVAARDGGWERAQVPGWRNIQRWFEGADAWPIRGYVPSHSRAEQFGLALAPWGRRSVRERIAFMESDDDLRYTLLGLTMLEERGLNFSSWDIGKLWHRLLPYSFLCTAETQAYRNFTHVTTHQETSPPADWAAQQHWVRTYRNPYREWIGAQIRADGWAYGAAGRPELAAELAWRDASFSHVKNGIYGAMYIAAMIAAAFVETDMERIVAIGLSEIPQQSRLTAAIQQALEIAHTATDQVNLVQSLWRAFDHYDPAHTINNAALVTAALLFAGDDFERAITTAVLGGWDTDCNGATVGSIMGAKLGHAGIPPQWSAPLADTLYGEISGFEPIAISECARRSHAVFRKLQPATVPSALASTLITSSYTRE